MPSPIKPNGYNGRERPDGLDPIDLSVLIQGLANPTAKLSVEADIGDVDADSLFGLWESSKILKASENIEDRLYEVPESYPQDTLMRLKTKGLLYGTDRQIKFTIKAAKIIKMLVLSETNNFRKKSVKKPYSVILAETKIPKRKSNLALASSQVNLTKTS